MNSADEKVFEEALSGALADIQSDWENPDALLLACKDALPPDYVPSCLLYTSANSCLQKRFHLLQSTG